MTFWNVSPSSPEPLLEYRFYSIEMWLLYWRYSKWYVCCGYQYLCDCNKCLSHLIAHCTTMYFSTHINRALWGLMRGISRLRSMIWVSGLNYLCRDPSLVTLPLIEIFFWSYMTLLCGHSTAHNTRGSSARWRTDARSHEWGCWAFNQKWVFQF